MNTQYLDISVRSFTGHFTSKAKSFNVTTQILMKLKAADLTTIRLTGTLFDLTEFLRFLTLSEFPQWTEQTVQMHVNAIKTLTESGKAPHWKNRGLYENRANA